MFSHYDGQVPYFEFDLLQEIEWRNRLREVENQLKLSLSEREMQNVAAVEQSQIRDLEAEIEQLKTVGF